MKPPLIKGIVDEGRYRSIIVWEGFGRDVETPHSRREYRCSYDAESKRYPAQKGVVYDSQICAFTDAMDKSHRIIVAIITLVPWSMGMESWAEEDPDLGSRGG